MRLIRKIWLILALTAHFYLLLMFNKKITLKKINYFYHCPRLAQLHSPAEHLFALKFGRKMCQLHGIQNICFITSLLIYWLGHTHTIIHFGLDVQAEVPLGHAWIEYKRQIYTTDLNFNGHSIHNFSRESVRQNEFIP